MAQNILNNTYTSSSNSNKEWGRTFNTNISSPNNIIYHPLTELSCNLQHSNSIINVVINMGQQRQAIKMSNPEVYYPQNKFKYNLFDSYNSTVIIIQ